MSKTKSHRAEATTVAAQHASDFDSLRYMTGFGAELSTEALDGALPEVGNTPQKVAYGLYAEQINGTAFTKVRHENRRSWFYRIKPAANHGAFQRAPDDFAPRLCDPCTEGVPDQMRWMPPQVPQAAEHGRRTFVQGLTTYCGAGDASMKAGIRVYMYTANASMVDESFSSSDGDMLIVPQTGTLHITSEMGRLAVPSGFICVMPRGVRFAVAVPAEGGARGYVCEVFDGQFELPPLGAIGANGLSNPRDFETPVAWYEDRSVASWTHYQKFADGLFTHTIDHSPFDVVAWHGNYAPYRYDLAKFCVVNSVSYDHLDPSIFCVLTAQTGEKGVASCDFVIFPPRWMMQENTFRPPYYHRNCMSEFMGNIRGVYEAKTDGGFVPGGATLHSPMAGHGPSADVFEKASNATLGPVPPDDRALAFMFESHYTMKMSKHAMEANRDKKYMDVWQGFKKHFNPDQKKPE